MDKTPQHDAAGYLTAAIEASVGRRIRTPRDFAFLRQSIFARLGIYISESTLKRVWGYISGGETRPYTLDVLSSFLGYGSWEEFIGVSEQSGGAPPSSFVLSRHLCVDRELRPGARVLLVWQPGRKCLISYLGDNSFKVVESENTRLRPDDTFSCAFIIEGEPLYLDNLRQGARPPVSYVCGRISGVRFQLIDAGKSLPEP